MKRKIFIYLILIVTCMLINSLFKNFSYAQSDISTINELVDKLSSPDKYIRSDSAKKLEVIAKENKAVIIKFLDDKRVLVRYHIIDIISKLGNPDDYDIIKSHLREEDDNLKIAAIYSLIKLNADKASNDIVEIYREVSFEVRKNIIYVLGEIKKEQSIEFLVDELHNEMLDIRQEAIIALVKIDNEKAIPPLINYLNQFREDKQILLQMPKLGIKLIEPLLLNLPEVDEGIYNDSKNILEKIIDKNTDEALLVILKFYSSAINPVNRMVKELIIGRESASIRPAVEILKKARGKLREDLIGFISKNPDTISVIVNLNKIWTELENDKDRVEVIKIMMNLENISDYLDVIKDFLVCNLTHPSEEIRNCITMNIKSAPIFVDAIVQKMKEAKDEKTRNYYKETLINLWEYNLGVLLELFNDEKLQADVTEIFVRLKYKNVDEFLVRLLGMPEIKYKNLKGEQILLDKEKIRAVLIKRSPFSAETIVENINNGEGGISKEVRDLMIKIGEPVIPYLIKIIKDDTDEIVTDMANKIVLEIGEKAVPYLTKEAGTEDLWSKMNIAHLLIKLNREEAIPALIAVLKTDDSGLQYRAIYALRDLGNKAIPELVKNMDNNDENILTGIIRSLGEIKDKSVISNLKGKLALTENEKIKKEIEKALSKIGG